MWEYKDYLVSGNDIYEIVPHFVAFKAWKAFSSGTAVFIAANLLITSQHVIQDIIEKFYGKAIGTEIQC